jgi:lipopolysaccharide export system permease protein
MRTVRRLLYADVIQAVAFVAVAFLALFFFIDFVDELADVGPGGYRTADAAWRCVLLLPRHLYELLPIAVLIGAIYAMARMAQSSEFTILRTGGLSPGRALSLLAWLGLVFAVITLLVGDLAAPAAQRRAELFKAGFHGGLGLGRTGAWLKDTRPAPDGEHRLSINIGQALSDDELRALRIFELDAKGTLVERIIAERAEVTAGRWLLRGVTRMQWDDTAPGQWRIDRLDQLAWTTQLSASVVAAATLPLDTMNTPALFTYMSHLQSHGQEADRYEIAFWKRALYPLACLVMMALALPFAYLHARRGSISVKVFGGIMLGISFVLLNNVSSHVGQLQHWAPWAAALTPSALYLLLSLGAFAWLVRYR